MPFPFTVQAQGRPPLMGACCSEVEAAPGSAAAKTMPAPLPVASPYRMEGGRRHQFFVGQKHSSFFHCFDVFVSGAWQFLTSQPPGNLCPCGNWDRWTSPNGSISQ